MLQADWTPRDEKSNDKLHAIVLHFDDEDFAQLNTAIEQLKTTFKLKSRQEIILRAMTDAAKL